ncbi:hypothetical protein [Acinetobacter calcoaceticus]|uniref:hypothetical protein n=1 Tax=Acinetobacter calcoaceticus TaxID=471 RepID=UPI0018DC733F|nr:hypothetical protein [Acinetobacter calcoaceticus]
MNKERKDFIEAMKKNGCPMWMFERDEDGNFEDMGMAYAWYAWQEKAKTQAVPEGYCLVPKTPTQKMIDGSHGLCLPQDVYKAMLRLNEFKAQDKVIIEGDKRVWNIDTINSNGFHSTTINKPTRCLIHVFGDQHVRHATTEEIREASESGAES